MKPTYEETKKAYREWQSGIDNGGEFWDMLQRYFNGDEE